jgi:hypothetical protein
LTFYNIIFGILFLCAVRELLQAWFDREWVRFWMAAVLTMLISNDILFTSHLIEERHVPYTIAMKLSDLLDFVLLSIGVLMLSPRGNLLGVDAQRGDVDKGAAPCHARREPSFWGLICAYWCVCLLWDVLGGAYDGDHLVWRRSIPYLFFIPLLATWCLAFGLPRGRLLRLARPTVTLLAALYLLAFKAPEINSLEQAADDRKTADRRAQPSERKRKVASSGDAEARPDTRRSLFPRSAWEQSFGGRNAPRYNVRATTATPNVR